MKYTYTPPASSLKNNLLLSFLIVSVLGGIAVNILFHSLFIKQLYSYGFNLDTVKHIDREFTIYFASASLIGIVIVLLIGSYLAHRFAGPLQKLSKEVNYIAEGNFSKRVDIKSNNEIGMLAEGFNFMAQNIETSLKKIKASKEHTDNILGSVPTILIVVSNRLNIISSNLPLKTLHLQYPTLQSIDFILTFQDEIKNTIETGNTIRKEIMITPESTHDTLFFTAAASCISSGEHTGNDEFPAALLSITDITDRRKMKEMVLQSRQDWEGTFDTLPDMITIHDKDYNIIMANKAAKAALDLPLLSPEGRSKCFKYYHGTDEAPNGCPSCKCYESAQPATFELFENHLNKYIEIRSIPRINQRSEVIGLIHVVRDITQRKKIEKEHHNLLEAVTKAKLEWEATFDTVNELIALVDKDFTISRCNQSFAYYVGLPENELTGCRFFDHFILSDSADIDRYHSLVASDTPLTREEVLSKNDRWFYMSFRPIMDKDGAYMNTAVLATDITDIKTTHNRLIESEQELKKKVNDLEKFYEMAVGRECKMKKLKEEIHVLKANISQSGEGQALES